MKSRIRFISFCMAFIMIFGIVGGNSFNSQAAGSISSVVIKVPTMLYGEKLSYDTKQFQTIGSDKDHYSLYTDYNKDGFKKGIKWEKVLADNKRVVLPSYITADSGETDSEYICLNIAVKANDGYQFPASNDAFRLEYHDVDTSCGKIEEINRFSGYVIIRIKCEISSPRLEKISFKVAEPKIGEKVYSNLDIEDYVYITQADGITNKTYGKVLTDDARASIDIGDTWEKSKTLNAETWIKVEKDETFEEGYYYRTNALWAAWSQYKALYRDPKNHAEHKNTSGSNWLGYGKTLSENLNLEINGKVFDGTVDNSGEWNDNGRIYFNKPAVSVDTVGVEGVILPKANAKPSYTATSVNSTRYEVSSAGDYDNWHNGVIWKEIITDAAGAEKESKEITSETTFQAGHKYSVTIRTKALGENKFANYNDLTFLINGETCKTESTSPDYVYLREVYTCPNVSDITISGISTPLEGDKASYGGVSIKESSLKLATAAACNDPNGSYYKNGIAWGILKGENYLKYKYNKCVFDGNQTYQVDFVVVPGDKNTFIPSDLEGKNSLNVTVNGADKAEVKPEYFTNENKVLIRATYKSKNAISEIAFNVKEPVIGEKPSDICSFALDGGNKSLLTDRYKNTYDESDYSYHMTVPNNSWTYSKDGKKWTKMSSEDTFKAGIYYKTSAPGYIKGLLVSDEESVGATVLYGANSVGIKSNAVIKFNGKAQDVSWGDVDSDYAISFKPLDPISLSKAKISGVTDKTYTGKAITQSITVTLNDVPLKKNVDYKISYENNTNVGKATLIVTGIGNYTGTKKTTFKIKEKTQTTTQKKTQATTQATTQAPKPVSKAKKINGVGTLSADGKTIKDKKGTYRVASTLKKSDLKTNLKIADKKSGGKYKITKLTKKGGKIVGGTVAYIAPYNKNTTTISATGKVKLGGVTFTVTSIGKGCAKGCKKLTKVVIGAGVTNIGQSAFNGCSKLKSITIKSTKLKKVGANAFKGIHKKAVIKVPSSKKKAYTKLLKKKGQAKTVKIK